MDRLLRRLSRAGFRRGMAGQHWAWFVVALAAAVLRRARRQPARSATIPLQPGDRYLVALHDPAQPDAG